MWLNDGSQVFPEQSGVVLQAILRNSLAEPYLLGTSSGAGLGAALSIIMGVSAVFLPVAAFCGAILSIILVYNLAKQNGKLSEQSLILIPIGCKKSSCNISPGCMGSR